MGPEAHSRYVHVVAPNQTMVQRLRVNIRDMSSSPCDRAIIVWPTSMLAKRKRRYTSATTAMDQVEDTSVDDEVEVYLHGRYFAGLLKIEQCHLFIYL